MYNRELVTNERLAELKIKRAEMRDAKFFEVEKKFSKDLADALRDLYDIYDEGMYLWLASLWEPEIGAFYFSESGRDTEGFLPDIESTMQAMGFLGTAGLTAAAAEEHEKSVLMKMRASIASYAEGLQDPDGYFYHPQWGKDITVSRRGRDLGWATSAIRDYGGKMKYPSPLDRKEEGNAPSTLLPEHLRSVENLKKYLSELDLMNRSYYIGNLIQSQVRQIIAAGPEFVDTVYDWYVTNQNQENGLWGSEVCHGTTNGLMKVCLALSAFGKEMPNPEKSLHSCFEVMLNDVTGGGITSYYNPWITVSMILSNMRKFGNTELASKLYDEFITLAPEMIRKTKDKVKIYKKVGGCYGYLPDRGCPASQGAPVADPAANEGDINGNALSTTGVVANVCRSLGFEPIPLFCYEDGKLIFELFANSYPSTKIYPPIDKKA